VNQSTPSSGIGLEWTLANLPATESRTLTFQATVNAGAKATFPSISNTASYISSDQLDSVSGNNNGISIVTIVGLDLVVTKTVNIADPVEGDTVRYTVNVRNASSQTATAVRIRDQVPAGVTYVAASISGGDVRNDGTPAGSGLLWDITSLAGGADVNLIFDATVNSGTGGTTITNSANYVSSNETEDDPSNNIGSVDITPKSFDVAIVKSISVADPEEGEEVTYSLSVSNTTVGTTGTNIVVEDVLPSFITYVPGSILGGDTRSDASPSSGSGLNWTINSLVGGSAPVVLSFRATIDTGAKTSSGGTITNTANITSVDQVDSIAANDTSSVIATIKGLDISVNKSVDEDEPVEGNTITYTIAVENTSSQAATGVNIRDIVPNGVTYVPGSIAGGDTRNESTPDSGTGLTWVINTLTGSQVVNLTFDAVVDSGAVALNPIRNTANFVSINETEDNTANNDGFVDITVKSFDISLQKLVSESNPEEGEEITYTIRIDNTTVGTTGTNIVVNDIVPNGLTYVPGSIAGGDSRSAASTDSAPGLSWTINSLTGAATPVDLTFRATVDAGALALNPLTNTAQITSVDQVDSIPANDSDSVDITVTGLDIEVLKAVSDTEPTEGDTVSYTITVNNLSSQTATNIVIRDIVPNGVTYVPATIAGGTSRIDTTPDSGNGLEWTIASLVGTTGTASLTFNASVDAGAISLNPINNTATLISLTESEDVPGNNSGSAGITVKAFDVAVTKAASKPNVEEGETFTYTINVANTSSAAVGTNIVVSDVVPPGLTYVPGTMTGPATYNEADPNGAGLSWTIASLAASSNVNLTFQATVNAGAQATYPTILNTANYVSSDQVDSVSANNAGDVSINVVGLDISIDKSVNEGNPEEGEEVTYTIVVENLSSQAATNIVIEDLLPLGITYVPTSIAGGDTRNDATPSAGSGLGWTIASLGSSLTRTLTFRATVDTGAKDTYGTITNTALISGLDQTDDQLGNNSNTADIIVRGLDIEVTKSVSDIAPTEGDQITYTINVNNRSSQTATAINIRDIVPNGVTYVPGSISALHSPNDSNPDTTGLTWTVASLAGGIDVDLTFEATVDVGAIALNPVTNTANLVSIAESEDDPLNNIGSVDINVRAFDISVSKSASTPSVEEGETFKYTIIVRNESSTASGTNIVITDIVPPGLTFSNGTMTGGSTRDQSNPSTSGLVWTIANLAAQTDVTLEFDATVDAGAKALFPTIINTVDYTSSDQADSNSANNSATASVNVIGLDLSIVKSVDESNPEEGQEITYTLTVANLGTQTATNVDVRDVIPPGLTYVPASITGGDTSSGLDPPGAGLTWTINSLLGGASVPLTFRATVNSGAKVDYGTIPNTATITDQDQTDDLTGNNTDTETITVRGLDIEVLKAVSDNGPTEGDTITYTITVNNTSSQTATNILVRDIVPNGVTYVPGSISAAHSPNEANPDTTGLTWTIASLAGSGSEVLSFNATVDLGAVAISPITNSAELVSITETEDNAANNTGSVVINARAFDISVQKSSSKATVEEGETFTYTIAVTNETAAVSGTNLVVTDVVPAGLTYVPGTMTGGTTVDQSSPTGTGLRWTIASLAAGVTENLSFQASVNTGAQATNPSITNTANFVSSDQADSVVGNNSDDATVTVIGIDIRITKSVDISGPEEGQEITYTLLIENLSSQPATNIDIEDRLPLGITYVPGSISAAHSPIDTSPSAGSGLTWTVANLAGLGSETLSFRATVDAGAKATYGTITNTGLIADLDQTDDQLGNNSDTADITVVGLDLTLTKTVDEANPVEGNEVEYTVTVTNTSSQPATNVVVTDIVPNGVTYKPGSISCGSSNNDTNPDSTGLTWNIASILGAGSSELKFIATVDAGAQALGTITNTAAITSATETLDNTGDDSDTADITAKTFDVSLDKQVSNPNAEEGETVTYTITVTNTTAGSTGTNIQVTDVVPDGVTYVTSSILGGDSRSDGSPTVTGLTWDISSIVFGTPRVLTFQAVVDAGAKATTPIITNTAAITAVDQADSNSANDTNSADITVRGIDLAIDKTVSNANPEEGSEITYTLTVSNLSTQPATNVNVSDVVPPGLTYVPGSISVSHSPVDADPTGAGLSWTIPTVNGMTNTVLSFRTTVDPGAKAAFSPIRNTANIDSLNETDDQVANNTDFVDITVIGIDLNITKSVDNANPEEGQTVVYTVSVQNLSSQAATNVVLRDIVPAGLTYVPGSMTGANSTDESTPTGAGLAWTFNTVGGGATLTGTFSATVDVGAKALSPITNNVTLGGLDQSEDNPGNNVGSVPITVRGIDLEVLKTVDEASPVEGNSVVYTIRVNNLSTQQATNVRITDVVPPGVTYTAATISGSAGVTPDDANPDTSGLFWDIAAISGGGSAVLEFTASVDAGAQATFGTVRNTANLTAIDQSEDNSVNNTSFVDITIQTFDVAIAKTVLPLEPEEGETVTYTITATNTTAGVLGTNIVVNDLVPAGVTYVPGSMTGTSSTFNESSPALGNGLEWTIGSLAGSAVETMTFQAVVNAGAKATYGTIINTGSRLSSDQVDSNSGNDADTAQIEVKGLDIDVQKSVDVNDPIEGQEITYTIDVTNTSNQAATNVLITDVVPPGVTYVPGSISAANSPNDSNPATSGLTWNIASLAGAGVQSLTFRAVVDAGAQTTYGTVTNTSSLTSVDQTEDSPVNNTDTASITIRPFDLSVTKTVDNTNPEEGQTVTYTISVENLSSAAATNVVIGDVVPDGVTYVASSISGGASRSAATPDSGPGLQWTIANIAASGTESVTFQATVDAGAKDTFGTVTNTGRMTALDQIDGNPSNDAGDALITIKGLDLAVTKNVDNASPEEGEEITYTISVANTSTQAATNVVIGDVVPPGVTYVPGSISATHSPNDSDPSGTGLRWTVASLAVGAPQTFTFRATVDIGAKVTYGTIVNTGSLISLDQSEENASNNSDDASITVRGLDLQVTKVVDKNEPFEGETVTYTVTVTNLSSQVATNVDLKDIVPPGVTYVPATIGGGDSRSDGAPATTGLSWTVLSLPAGGSVPVTFQATVDAGAKATYGTVLNEGFLDDLDQSEDNTGNNRDTALITIKGIDLQVTKLVDNNNPVEGNQVEYTVSVENLSPFDATNVSLKDIVPDGVTYVPGSLTGADSFNDSAPSGALNGLTWAFTSVQATQTRTITFRATVDAGAQATFGTITNTAEFVSADQSEDNVANNTDSVLITVKAFDLTVTKTVNKLDPEEGEEIEYTINVINNISDETGTNVVIGDLVPPGVTYVPGSITGGDTNDEATPTAGNGLTWNINTLAGGATVPLSFRAVVDAGAKATYGTITNTGRLISLDQVDSDPSNNNGAIDITVKGLDLGVVKTVDNAAPVENEVVEYTITVNNLSSQTATGILIKDVVPNGVTYQAGSISGGTSRDDSTPTSPAGLNWTIASIAPGSNVSVTFQARVDIGAYAAFGTVTNSAQFVSADQSQDNPANDVGSVDIVIQTLDIEIEKLVSDAEPNEGQEITYTIRVKNFSGTTATGAVIRDIVPTGVTYVPGSIAGGSSQNEVDPAGTGLEWTVASIPGSAPGNQINLTFRAVVDAGARGLGSITNTGSLVSLDQTDSDPSNDNDDASFLARGLDLVMVKTVSDAAPTEQDVITYTLTVTNNGPSDATNITLRDIVPAGLTYQLGTIGGAADSTDQADPAGAGLEWTINALANGASAVVTFDAEVDLGTGGTVITNTGSMVSVDQTDENGLNDSDDVNIAIAANVDIEITKSSDKSDYEEGETVTYTIRATNLGPSQASGVILRDVMPNDIIYTLGTMTGGDLRVESDPYAGGLRWTINNLSPIGPMNFVDLTFQGVVAAGANLNTPVTNNGELVQINQTEINPINDIGPADINILNNLDISLAKGVSDFTPDIGQTITYRLFVTNLGPTRASQVVINDVIPAGLFYLNGTDVGADSVNSGDPNGAGVDFTIAQINAGQTVTVEFDLIVLDGANLNNPIVNTALYTGSQQTDVQPSNDSADVIINVNPDLDIEITKTVDNNQPFEFEEVTYTINVRNNGPAAASNVEISDVIDASLTYVPGSITGGDAMIDGSPYSGTGLTWTLNQLLRGADVNLTFRAAPVGGTSGTTVGNTGLLLSLDQPDINAANDTSNVDVMVRNDADLAITQVVTPSLTPSETDELTYTLTVLNNGPSVSRNVVIENLVPAGMTYVSGSILGADIRSDASPAAGGGLTWTATEILNGASVTLTYRATVDPGTYGQTIRTNSAITAFSSTESDFTNNTTFNDIVVDNSLDLEITKNVDNSTPVEGDTLTYTVNITNNGPKTRASNISLIDVIPSGITYVGSTPSGGMLVNDSDPGGAGLVLSVAQLEPSQTATLVYTVTVDPRTAGDAITNTLTSISLDQVDTNATADKLIETVNVQNVIDLQLVKTVNITDPGVLLDDVIYTLTLTNNGPSVGENIVVTDVLDPLLDYESATISGADSRSDASPEGSGLTWTVNEILPGATVVMNFTVKASLNSKDQTITNTASYTHPYTDTNSNDNLSVDIMPVGKSDIHVTKTVDNSVPAVGQSFKYILTLNNNGPIQLDNTVIVDQLPTGVSYISDDGAGTYNPLNGEWTIVFLPSGASTSLEITAAPDAGFGGQTITNTITAVNTTSIDLNLTPDDFSEDILVTDRTDVFVDGVVINANPVEGDTFTMTFNVLNRGPQIVTNLLMRTVVPPGLTFVPASQVGGDTINQVGTTLEWTVNTLAVGVTEALTFDVVVDAGTGGTAIETIIDLVSMDQTEDTATPDNNRIDLFVQNNSDIVFTKSANLNAVNEGESIVFTITATNNGPAQVRNLEIDDILSTFFTLDSAVPTQGSYSAPAWIIGTLNNGQTETLTLNVTVNPGAAGQTIINRLENQNQLQTDTDITPSDLEETIVVGANTDLEVRVTIIDDPGADSILDEGQIFTYQIELINNGPNRAANLSLDFFSPSQVDFVGGGATPSVGTFFFPTWTLPAVETGTSEILTVQARVKAGTFGQVATASVVNLSFDQADNNLTPDDNSEVFTVDDKVDLYITKISDVPAPQEGDEVTFTVQVENKGPAAATGIQIEDIFPSTLLDLEFTSVTKGSFNQGTLLWDISSLLPNEIAILTLNSRVKPGAGGATITNRVQLNSFDQTDSDVTPDDLEETLNVSNNVNLEISKVVSNPTPNEGETITYTLTVKNNGPSEATNFELTDVLPVGVTFVSATTNLGSFTADTWSAPSILNGFIAVLEIQAKVDFATGGTTIRNEITGVTIDQDDPIGTSNDILFADIVVKNETDLAITKTSLETIYSEGDAVQFTIEVTNNGPALAEAVSLEDQLPAGLTYVTHAESLGTTFTQATGVWDLSNIPVGQTATLTIDATVNAGTNGQFITNTLTNVALEETDLDTTADDLEETIQIVNELDLVVSIVSDVTSVDEQGTVKFTVNVLNLGPARATNVVLGHLLPIGFTFVSGTTSEGTFNDGALEWTLPNVGRNESFDLEIEVTADEGAGGQTLTATAQVNSVDQNELDTGNDIDTADVIINHNNNLILGKTVDNNAPREGETVVFTLTVENQGPAQSQNLEITDIMPAGLTFAAASGASQGTFAAGVWTVGSLSSGNTASIDISAIVDAGTNGQTILNLISNVSQDETDVDPSGDDLEEELIIDKRTDLQITKIVDESNPEEGETVEFTITAANNGPIGITNLVIDDAMPAGLTFSSAATPSHGTFTDPQWTIPVLNNGETATLRISATVDVGTANTTITNVITNVVMDQDDETPANDDLEEAVSVANVTDLVVTKVVDNINPNELDSVNYTIQVTNNGPARATNVVIEDPLPAGLGFVGAGATQGAYSGSEWTVGTLENGQIETLTLTASVNLGQSGSSILNQITNVTLDQTDTNPAGDDLDELIIVGNNLDLDIRLTSDKTAVDEGENFIYTIDVINNGPNQASGLTITDIWPAQLDVISADQPGFDTVSKIWNIGILPIGGRQTVNVTAVAKAGTAGQTATNTLNYALNQTDSTGGDILTVDVIIKSDLDLVVTKTVDNSQPNELDTVVFTIRAENKGPARATNVAMRDVLPPQFAFTSVTTSFGTTFTDPDWTIPQLDAGETMTLDITASVNAGTAGQTAVNTVTNIVLDQNDTNASPDDLSEQVTIRNESDIHVTKTLDKTIVKGDETATFIITVENKGPLVVNALQIDDDLDELLVLVSQTATQGTFTEPVWNVGTLAVGATAKLRLEVRATEDAANNVIRNEVSRIASDRLDNNATPDILIAELNVLGENSVLINLIFNKTSVTVGDLLGVEMRVESLLNEELNPLAVTALLPQGLSYAKGTVLVQRAGPDGIIDTEDDVKSQLDSEEIRSLAVPQSLVNTGRTMDFFMNTGANEIYKIFFMTRVGSTAIGGGLIATAFAEFGDFRVTSEVKAQVLIKKNELFDMTSIIGKVFHDRDKDGYQDESIVRNLRVYGGTPFDNVAEGDVMVDRGTGFEKIRGGVEKGFRLGSIRGRSSRNDYSKTTRVVLKVPVKEKLVSKLELTTSEGTAITLEKDGQLTERHSGLRRKGMSGQDILVARSVVEENGLNYMIVEIHNVGVDEEGLPGVRIYGVNGLAHETDEFGRYNIPDIELQNNRGQNYILKVDAATLPRGSVFTTENPRVLRITGGLFTKFNFGVNIPFVSEGKIYQSKKVSDVYFDTNKANIRNSEVDKLDKINRELSSLPLDLKEGSVKIQGYTDFTGSAAKNRTLSLERAKTVLNKIKDVAPELDFNIKLDNANPNEQELVTYVAQVKNKGLADVSNLSVVLPLPKQLSREGRITSSNGNFNGERWVIKSLEGKSSARLEFKARVNKMTSDEDFDLTVKSYIYEGFEKDKRIKGVVAGGRVQNELDLNVVTSAEKIAVDERETFSYSITASNNGPAVATKLVMSLLRDKNINIQEITVSHGQISKRGKWNVGNLMSGEVATATVVANAKEGTATKNLVVGVSTIYADQVDTDVSEDRETLELRVNNNLDLVMASNFNVEQTNEGDRIRYTVVAENKGPIKATNVEVSVAFDENLELISHRATKGRFKDSVWTISSIDWSKSESLVFEVAAKPRSGGSALTAKIFDVAQDQIDLGLDKDKLEDTVLVLNNADLLLTKSISNENPQEREELLITWKIVNRGPAVAERISLIDELHADFLKVSDLEVNKGKASGIKWDILELMSGESATMTRTVKVAEGAGGSTIKDAVEKFTHEQLDNVRNSKDYVEVYVGNATNIILVKEFSKTKADEGEDIKTVLRLKNMGPAMANEIVIKDEITSDLINHRNVKSSSNSSLAEKSWSIPALKVGETAELEWTSTVAAGLGGKVITDKIDSIVMLEKFKVISKGSLQAKFRVNNETDLVTQVNSSTKNIDLGEDFKVTYTIENRGPAMAKNISLAPPVDKCLELVSSKTDKGITKGNRLSISKLTKGDTAKMIWTVRPKYSCSSETLESVIGDLRMEQTELSEKDDVVSHFVKVNNEVDVVVGIDSSLNKLSENDKVTFKISQTHRGPAFVNSAELKYALSDSLEIENVKPTKGSVKDGTWTLENMQFKDQEVLEITARVKFKTSNMKAFIKVKSHKVDKADTNRTQDAYSKEFIIENRSDISVDIQALDQKVNVPYVSYRYTVRNNGPAVATNVQLKPLYDQSALSPISMETAEGTVYKRNSWKIAEVYPGQSVELLWNFEVQDFSKKLGDAGYADLELDQKDLGLTADINISSVEVSNMASVKVKKRTSRKDIYETETYEYVIEVENTGSQIARKIVIQDDIDGRYVKIVSPPKMTRGEVVGNTWRIEELRAGEKVKLRIPVRFVGRLKENVIFVDPIDDFKMEQANRIDNKKNMDFRYGVKNIIRTLSGETDGEKAKE
jgi:uncharacterized repeat protein (TIGR01451 family)